MDIDGLQVTDASPIAGGGYSTDLVDPFGNVVATVTRDSSGVTQAAVVEDAGGFDLSKILDKVTGFLESVAQSAQQTSDEAARVANAAKGAVAGAKIGYKGPVNWTPWLIAGGVGLLALFVAAAGSSSRRR